MVRPLSFHCRGHRFDPWSGTKISHASRHSRKKEKKDHTSQVVLQPFHTTQLDPLSSPYCNVCVGFILGRCHNLLCVLLRDIRKICSCVFIKSKTIFIFFFFNLLCILFLAVLGLCCCANAFSGCGELGLLLSCGARTCGFFPDQESNQHHWTTGEVQGRI